MIASVLAIRLPWLTLTSLGSAVDPEVAMRAAGSSSLHAAGAGVAVPLSRGAPSRAFSPQRDAQSPCRPLSDHTAVARVLRASASPVVASVLSLTGTATSPPNTAPR